ncbi:nucleotidyltransferase domain-containing protein, partial [Candidatus Bathyarchaeota archaeon]|nr:nucleotidyltransferase domain-containing protein [Candidatus Bathyarchaeota archaeon]
SLKGDQVSNLKRVVEVLSRFDGVIGVFLFGSYARGTMMSIRTLTCLSFLRIRPPCGGVGATYLGLLAPSGWPFMLFRRPLKSLKRRIRFF